MLSEMPFSITNHIYILKRTNKIQLYSTVNSIDLIEQLLFL